MTELHHLIDQHTKDMNSEILARKVRELILANDPEEIIIAAKVVMGLPSFGIEEGKLVETQTLDEKITRHIGRVGTT